ncbi:SanA/YdcF family protein [Paenibacillus sp. y28]|uniref:SanA/YdcF family protein n=1 Tax=Paenibacillus sp. y28 TaxID=3129110 RepID=UPI0030185518
MERRILGVREELAQPCKRKRIRKRLLASLLTVLLGLCLVLTNDGLVRSTGKSYVVGLDQAPQADAIIVLGAYVRPDGSMSMMLQDRVDTAVQLYGLGKAKRLLMSGDHGRKEYDEVNTMREYAEQQGVESAHVFMDHAGFNTYDSMYRAREVFRVKKAIIVTQEYHLLRALFIARQLGIEAYGVAADRHDYGIVMQKYELREIAARNKDLLLASVLRPKPQFLGDPIPITGDGRLTRD